MVSALKSCLLVGMEGTGVPSIPASSWPGPDGHCDLCSRTQGPCWKQYLPSTCHPTAQLRSLQSCSHILKLPDPSEEVPSKAKQRPRFNLLLNSRHQINRSWGKTREWDTKSVSKLVTSLTGLNSPVRLIDTKQIPA